MLEVGRVWGLSDNDPEAVPENWGLKASRLSAGKLLNWGEH